MTEPTVSVVMPSYNHAAYLEEAIASVLRQRGVNFELLICDDGSSDSSGKVLQSQSDPRIRVTIHSENRGGCTTLNELISQCRADYIALINSDDAWQGEDKLLEQLELLQSNPNIGASFGKADFIDAESKIIPDDQIALSGIFNKENQSRSKWLRAFFEHGNSICHPTMMIRKRCYVELGVYNNRFRQLPDLEMWTRLVKKYDIHISDKKWIKFRLIAGENTSAPTKVNSTRAINEQFIINSKLLDDVAPDMLQEMFPELLPRGTNPSPAHFDIAKVIAFFNAGNPTSKNSHDLMGLIKLKELLDKDEHARILRDEYKIDDRWFHQKMGEHASLTHGFVWGTDPEEDRHAAEVSHLKQMITAQNDVIENMRRDMNRPLLGIAAQRLMSKIF